MQDSLSARCTKRSNLRAVITLDTGDPGSESEVSDSGSEYETDSDSDASDIEYVDELPDPEDDPLPARPEPPLDIRQWAVCSSFVLLSPLARFLHSAPFVRAFRKILAAAHFTSDCLQR